MSAPREKKTKSGLKNLELPIHTKARGPFPDYPTRFTVPDDKVSWESPFPEYKPVEFTAESTLKYSKEKRDPKEIPDLSKRISFEQSPLFIDPESGRPRNPHGRTGLSGRGTLWQWGPNHAADPIVTKVDEKDGKIYMVAIQKKDTGVWAIPGGMVDPGETVSATLRREFQEEAVALGGEKQAQVEALLKELFSPDHAKLVYKGYVDDPRNTDNSWMETAAYLYHCSPEIAKALPLTAGDDAAHVKWLAIDDSDKHYRDLFASHKYFVDHAAAKLRESLKDSVPKRKSLSQTEDDEGTKHTKL